MIIIESVRWRFNAWLEKRGKDDVDDVLPFSFLPLLLVTISSKQWRKKNPLLHFFAIDTEGFTDLANLYLVNLVWFELIWF